MLVLQAIVPALARLAVPSQITVTGGTHNPFAPTFESLRDALAPQLRAIGWTIEYRLVRHGFSPAGGGELVATIAPARPAQRLVLVERGERLSHAPRAAVSHLARNIAVRELAALTARLDQLLVPLALTARGELRALRWTPHAEAQRELLRSWFARDIEVVTDDRGAHVKVPAMIDATRSYA